ncbi:YqcC family protein [Pleionea sp. CnH1-48]|uniref:YqcC family protein n=1 Tax=Pleionea sp. CnH1-48 TaxID=2954494 RepID=UPI0020976CFA|nr:YqcC family protein [Pleionea sp. CnH1-48]MCO7227238.1 YqcC family protein [Pleionea sp. CnH1-48]
MPYSELAELLLKIEAELRRLDMWAQTAPSEEALASKLPFCIDTLPFEHWLQFVMLPKMTHLVTSSGKLPGIAEVSPVAEVVYKDDLARVVELVRLLRQFDELSKQLV